jgi:hypothetical protein
MEDTVKTFVVEVVWTTKAYGQFEDEAIQQAQRPFQGTVWRDDDLVSNLYRLQRVAALALSKAHANALLRY